MGRKSTQSGRFRGRSLILWRAVVKGKELAQTDSKAIPRIVLLNRISRSLRQRAEATGTKKGGRRTSMEGKLVRGVHIRTQTPSLWWEVDLAENGMTPMGKKAGNIPPVHRLPQLYKSVSPGVREHCRFQLLPLTGPLDGVNTTVPDHAPNVESVEPSAAVDEMTLGKKSTVSSTVELLRIVRDSANGFGPLKSVARGLCLVLENCGVCPLSHRFKL